MSRRLELAVGLVILGAGCAASTAGFVDPSDVLEGKTEGDTEDAEPGALGASPAQRFAVEVSRVELSADELADLGLSDLPTCEGESPCVVALARESWAVLLESGMLDDPSCEDVGTACEPTPVRVADHQAGLHGLVETLARGKGVEVAAEEVATVLVGTAIGVALAKAAPVVAVGLVAAAGGWALLRFSLKAWDALTAEPVCSLVVGDGETPIEAHGDASACESAVKDGIVLQSVRYSGPWEKGRDVSVHDQPRGTVISVIRTGGEERDKTFNVHFAEPGQKCGRPGELCCKNARDWEWDFTKWCPRTPAGVAPKGSYSFRGFDTGITSGREERTGRRNKRLCVCGGPDHPFNPA